jgi:hypothetical protein
VQNHRASNCVPPVQFEGHSPDLIGLGYVQLGKAENESSAHLSVHPPDCSFKNSAW